MAQTPNTRQQMNRLAQQERQNAQMFRQMAAREEQAANQLLSANPAGAQNLAAQERRNQQLLSQAARREGKAATQLAGTPLTSGVTPQVGGSTQPPKQ